MLHSRDIDGKFYAPNYLNTIVQNNYDETSVNSKCDMKYLLLNHSQYPVVYYKGNTHPHWSTTNIKFSQNSIDEEKYRNNR